MSISRGQIKPKGKEGNKKKVKINEVENTNGVEKWMKPKVMSLKISSTFIRLFLECPRGKKKEVKEEETCYQNQDYITIDRCYGN